MTRRKRRNHSSAFKAKVALAAVKGEPAPGSYGAFAALTSIVEDEDSPDAEQMIRRLVVGQETVVRTARELFPVVDAASDEPTADLLTWRMQVHEKTAWVLRSMLG